MNKRHIKFLSENEIRQIIDAIPVDGLKNRRDRAIMETLFGTGLRVSELLSLKRKDILQGDPKETFELSITGKGGFTGTIYFSPQVLQAIFRYLAGRRDNDEALFSMTVRTAQRMVKARAKQAGIEKFISPHVFRHSFGTYVLNQTGNIRLCQEMLRHRSITSTEIYTHITSPQLKSAHKKIFK